MEEDFQKSQAKSGARAVIRLFFGYFKPPRVAITVLILMLMYAIVHLVDPFFESTGQQVWLMYPVLAGIVIVYVLTFTLFVRQLKLTKKQRLTHQALFFAVQTITSFSVIGFNVTLYWPIDPLMSDYPVLLAVAGTLFILLELSAIELLSRQLVQNKNIETA